MSVSFIKKNKKSCKRLHLLGWPCTTVVGQACVFSTRLWPLSPSEGYSIMAERGIFLLSVCKKTECRWEQVRSSRPLYPQRHILIIEKKFIMCLLIFTNIFRRQSLCMPHVGWPCAPCPLIGNALAGECPCRKTHDPPFPLTSFWVWAVVALRTRVCLLSVILFDAAKLRSFCHCCNTEKS